MNNNLDADTIDIEKKMGMIWCIMGSSELKSNGKMKYFFFHHK